MADNFSLRCSASVSVGFLFQMADSVMRSTAGFPLLLKKDVNLLAKTSFPIWDSSPPDRFFLPLLLDISWTAMMCGRLYFSRSIPLCDGSCCTWTKLLGKYVFVYNVFIELKQFSCCDTTTSVTCLQSVLPLCS